MKKLLIIGAGGFGREVYTWLQSNPSNKKEWELAGFLDDNLDALKSFGEFASVSAIKGHQVSPQNVYVCGLGLPVMKSKILSPFLSAGAEFITFIHPTATLGSRIKIGRGVFICPGVSVSTDISLGDFVMIGPNSTIGHDAMIGDWTTLCAQCDVTGKVLIGSEVFIGSRVSIIPSKEIGSRTILGAGAVVVSNVPDGVTMVGNPARIL